MLLYMFMLSALEATGTTASRAGGGAAAARSPALPVDGAPPSPLDGDRVIEPLPGAGPLEVESAGPVSNVAVASSTLVTVMVTSMVSEALDGSAAVTVTV